MNQCLALNVWPAPSARVIFVWLCSVCFNVSGLGVSPGQDGDPRSLILIITATSWAVQWFRISSCLSTVRPSSFHLTQTSATRRDERRSGNLLYAAAVSHPGVIGAAMRQDRPSDARKLVGQRNDGNVLVRPAPGARVPTGQEASLARRGKAARLVRHGSSSCEDNDCRAC